jgi:hypothetical protein
MMDDSVAEALRQVVIEPAGEGDRRDRHASAPRLDMDPEDVRRGLGQLVLTVAKLVHELLEKQAIRRIEGGSLTDEEVERLGRTLMLQAREIETLAEHFGVDPSSLGLDLGPLGQLV